MTERGSRSRLIQAVSDMADASYYRDRAEQALRLARDSTDPALIKTLNAFAVECLSKADAIDGTVLGIEPDDE